VIRDLEALVRRTLLEACVAAVGFSMAFVIVAA
jgi:hypothetical protein